MCVYCEVYCSGSKKNVRWAIFWFLSFPPFGVCAQNFPVPPSFLPWGHISIPVMNLLLLLQFRARMDRHETIRVHLPPFIRQKVNSHIENARKKYLRTMSTAFVLEFKVKSIRYKGKWRKEKSSLFGVWRYHDFSCHNEGTAEEEEEERAESVIWEINNIMPRTAFVLLPRIFSAAVNENLPFPFIFFREIELGASNYSFSPSDLIVHAPEESGEKRGI